MLSLALVVSQIEQRLLRRRAELLLAEIQSLELRKTPWPEAQQQFQHWAANRKFDDACNEHKCFLQITLDEPVLGSVFGTNVFVHLDDYFRWRFKLSYSTGPFVRMEQALFRAYVRVGGRPAMVMANVGMRDGIVWSKGFSVLIETYVHGVPGLFGGAEVEYALMADTYSVPRFDYYRAHWADPQLMLHPDYRIGRPSGCTVCVLGWAHFTPYADPADVHRLMQLDLSCLTRWHPCLTQSDIMPAAWKQYLAENARLDGLRSQPACSPSTIEMLGRDSNNIATGEILGYRESVDNHGYHHGTASVRALERLKGAAGWKPGETREVSVWSAPGRGNAQLQAGSRLIFFGGRDHSSEMLIDPGGACPIVSMNETNLRLVRRGIDQDYSAMDNAE